MFFLIATVLGYRAAILTVGAENRELGNLMIMSRNPIQLRLLNQHAADLQTMVDDIENYSFADISTSLRRTVAIVAAVNTEIEAQAKAWMETKSQMDTDSAAFLKLRSELETIRSLQDEEIVELRGLLAEAEQPSIMADTFNLVLTFVLGVFSSVLATMLLRRFRSSWKPTR